MISWFKDLVRGLVFLQKHGMVHRDLKMSNLLFSATGSIVISDFGKAISMGGNFEMQYHSGECSLPIHTTLYHIFGM